MLQVRRRNERGHANHGWLDTYHTFSFADYYDPRFDGFRSLRVINEDRVAPGMGFGTHGHRDMEIISYVLEGELQHRDSMGTGSVVRPGEVQRMSAGSGVMHSEFNASEKNGLHFLQIWIIPERGGITPSYEQKQFSEEERRGTFRRIASPQGEDGAIHINQDVKLHSALLDGDEASYTFDAGRYGWLQVASGTATVNGIELQAGDGVAISDEREVRVQGTASEVLLFDLA